MSLIRVFDGSDWILSSAQTAQVSEVAWVATYAEESGFADNAQADASGNDIEETYATKAELPKGMVVLSYGNSTWQDFLDAYNDNRVVYCRASSNSNPASGSQTRLAFMAYVNNATSPTEVEFQYYRSMSSHSAAQQGDQVFVYKLTSAGTWTVTTREASTKIAAGTNMTQSYSNGTLTLNATVPTMHTLTINTGGSTYEFDGTEDVEISISGGPSLNNANGVNF